LGGETAEDALPCKRGFAREFGAMLVQVDYAGGVPLDVGRLDADAGLGIHGLPDAGGQIAHHGNHAVGHRFQEAQGTALIVGS